MLFYYYETRDLSYTVTRVTKDSLRLKVSGVYRGFHNMRGHPRQWISSGGANIQLVRSISIPANSQGF